MIYIAIELIVIVLSILLIMDTYSFIYHDIYPADKQGIITVWHGHYAWWPVWTKFGLVWLQYVNRRKVNVEFTGDHYYTKWEYV